MTASQTPDRRAEENFPGSTARDAQDAHAHHTAEELQTARPDLRARMLTDAEAHRDTIKDELKSARTSRDNLRKELKRITDELNGQITTGNVVIRDLVRDQEEAEALLKSLTPRTRKPSATGAVNATAEAAARNADTEHGSA